MTVLPQSAAKLGAKQGAKQDARPSGDVGPVADEMVRGDAGRETKLEYAEVPQLEPIEEPVHRRRPWGKKFGDAFRGIKVGIRGHSSFFVHFFLAALVVAAGIVLGCGLVEWCILILCIGGVLAAELFNSAIETLFRGLDEATRERSWRALDVAAGAVLFVSITAAIVGLLVFGNRLIQILGLFQPPV